MSQVIIDVREKDEFEAERVKDSIHLPLSRFPELAPAVLKSLAGRELIILCRSGKRAGLALEQIRSFGLDPAPRCDVYAGGILEWKNQGRPTEAKRRGHFPVMRQVQMVAGGLVFSSAFLAMTVDRKFILLAGFVGAGLIVAGATGFCGMAELLCRMPWNRSKTS